MTAYAICTYLAVHDEQRIVEYRNAAHPLVEKFGGTVRVRPGPLDCREGPASQYMIIVEFPDLATARAWYESDEYQAARRLREGAAEVQVILTEGA